MTKKNIIVTGASSGIGFEIVKRMAHEGHNILAISRQSQSLSLLNHKNITILSIDITDANQLKKLEAFLHNQWQHVDVLINNAGHLVNKPFTDLSIQDFKAIYNVNVFAVANIIQIVLSFLKEGSHVVNISSMGGVRGSMKFPGLAAYSSSKGALNTLTEVLAEEYKDRHIAFNVLALGAVQTEMLAKAFPDYKAPTSAEEMANFITDFALTKQSYFNGKIIEVSCSTP